MPLIITDWVFIILLLLLPETSRNEAATNHYA